MDTEFRPRNGLVVPPGTRFQFPTGNSSNRPANPAVGDYRYNTDLNVYEGFYANGSWAAVAIAGLANNITIPQSITVGNSSQNTFVTPGTTSWGPGQYANGTAYYVGNGSLNSILSQGGLIAGPNVVVNSSAIGIGNSTVNFIATALQVQLGQVVIQNVGMTIGSLVANTLGFWTGNSTVNASMSPLSGLQINGGNVAVNSSGMFIGTTMTLGPNQLSIGNNTNNVVVNTSGIFLNGSAFSSGGGASPGRISFLTA